MTVIATKKKEAVTTLTRAESFTNIVLQRECKALELFGPSVQFLVVPQPSDEAPCVMKGTIPPGAFVPVHSHLGVESFFVLSGGR